MSESFDSLFGQKVLAIYRCGSRIYGLEGSDSDEDYIAVLEGDFLPNVIKTDTADYFTYGKNQFQEAVQFKPGYLSYFTIWLDNTTVAEKNLVYIDPDFKDEFLKICKVEWEKHYPEWLSANIDYFALRLSFDPCEKSLYSLYRLHSIVKRYKETGIFESVFNDDDRILAADFKNNPEKRKDHEDRLKAIFSYLQDQLKEDAP